MTVPLAKGAVLRRKVDGGRFGPLIMEAEEGVIYLREPGRRTRMGPVSWENLYVTAASRLAAARRKSKPKTPRSARMKVGI